MPPNSPSFSPLLSDLYQFTMAHNYWRHGMYDHEAVFHLYFRRAPFGGHYALAAGLQLAAEALRDFRFGVSEVSFLGNLRGNDGLPLFNEGFLNYLQRLRFAADVDALPEGTACFPGQPLLRVRGPLIQAQLVETLLLNIINFSSLIATKASRIVRAAGADPVYEFGLRRAQGPDGGLMASRAAYIGGCTGSSHVLAGQRYGIPIVGTHAHSWVMSFDSELAAFEAHAAAMPGNVVLLVDTYDTVQGLRHAIQVGEALRQRGGQLAGIRLDSGDLAALSRQARQMLDAAGFREARIIASDDLDEQRIAALKAQGAAIDAWGVGTRLVTAYEQPALGGVYKLAALRPKGGTWQYKIKYSEVAAKRSLPGCLMPYRWHDAQGRALGDVLADEWAGGPPGPELRLPDGSSRHLPAAAGAEALLRPVFRAGQCVYEWPSLADVRRHAMAQSAAFGARPDYPHGLSPDLWEKAQQPMP